MRNRVLVHAWIVVSALALLLTLAGVVVRSEVPAEAATAQPATLWGNGKPKRVKIVKHSKAIEVGTKFTAATDGTVTAVRFYKVAGMKGRHTGTLWTSGGKKLATVAFEAETASGWQTATLSNQVSLKRKSKYVVSLHVPAGGRYARTTKLKAKSATSALKVAAKKVGVYKYKKTVAFPETVKNALYWVDVVFTANAPAVSAASSGSVVSSFPKRSTTGVPAGWTPKQVVTGDYTITQDGQVVEDLRVTGGTLSVRAQNVTLRRVEIVSGQISNVYASRCYNGLRIEDTTILRGAEDIGQPAVQFGGYTAVRVKIDGPSEGFRVGGADYGCGPVSIQESFINVEPYAECASGTLPDNTWHGDAIQGYMGPALTLRNSYIRLGAVANCWGTAGFFYPSGQGNTRATVENVLIEGGAYSFRLETPGAVSGLKIVNDAWHYGAIYNRSACPTITWGAGNEIVTVKSDGTLASVRSQGCGG